MTTSTPMSLMGKTYVISDLTNASQQVTLRDDDINSSRIVIDNSLGTTSVFICSGTTSQTAVYPTSNSVPSMGRVVGAGTVQTWAKDTTHKFIAGIRESGTADVVIMVGSGE
jgi:hypothetical protein